MAGTYIGTVVGAGFASGQEILRFFALLGRDGWWGLLLATLLFALGGGRILLLGQRRRAASYRDVLLAVAGPRLTRVLDGVIAFFLFGAAATMVAAAGATVREAWGAPAAAGAAAMAALATGTVLTGLRGVTRSVSAVSPLLVGALLALAAATAGGGRPEPAPAAAPVVPWWPLAALLYVSFNLVGAIGVLAPLGGNARHRNALRAGAFLGALGLGAAAAGVQLVLHSDLSSLSRAEVPLVRAAARLAPWAGDAYAVVLLLEVYTTAVASLFGLVARLERHLPRGWPRALLLAGAPLLASRLGFPRLVATLYPLVGAAGLLLLAALARPYSQRSH